MRLREIRRNANLDQESLAQRLGIDRSTVSKWETGEAMPRADKLVPLARELGCTVDDLLHDTPGEGE